MALMQHKIRLSFYIEASECNSLPF